MSCARARRVGGRDGGVGASRELPFTAASPDHHRRRCHQIRVENWSEYFWRDDNRHDFAGYVRVSDGDVIVGAGAGLFVGDAAQRGRVEAVTLHI